MMKYIGLFVIFICCTVGGMAVSGALSRSMALSEGLLQFVRHVRGQVSYFKMPVDAICRGFQNESFQKYGLDKLICEKGLANAIEANKAQLNLSSETYALLLDFAHRMGTLSYAEQINDCDYLIGQLEREISSKKDEFPAKKQIYSSMGLLGGAMAVLILL